MNDDFLYGIERSIYRRHDDKEKKDVMLKIDWREANKFNEQHYGIFWTVNSFNGERKNVNLKRFLSWAIDIDSGSKILQMKIINKFIEPSLVIESKRGFHVYYNAVDGTTTDKFKEIMIGHLIPNLNADKGVNDLARVLRAPNFNHWKDANDPFFIKVIHTSNKLYSDEDMISGFPPKNDETKDAQKNIKYLRKSLKEFGKENVWAKVYEMDCEAALNVLSGTDAVSGEIYSFYRSSRGNKNITVNNEPSASWIDQHGRIGSRSGGGPTIWNWLYWLHKDHKKVYKFMKQYFPKIFEE